MKRYPVKLLLAVLLATAARGQPVPNLLPDGTYAHPEGANVRVVSIGQAGVILEIKAPGPVPLWREEYQVEDGHLTYSSTLLPVVVGTDPTTIEWRRREAEASAPVSAMGPRIDTHRPQPRKTLQDPVRPAVFGESTLRRSTLGPTGFDARWSNYGEYLRQMIETVQIEWDRVLETGRSFPPRGKVTIKFRLDSNGRIAAILGHTSTSNERGLEACLSGLTNRAPYGEWTPEMISALGTSQDLAFVFSYE
jgi:hypothetical protein